MKSIRFLFHFSLHPDKQLKDPGEFLQLISKSTALHEDFNPDVWEGLMEFSIRGPSAMKDLTVKANKSLNIVRDMILDRCPNLVYLEAFGDPIQAKTGAKPVPFGFVKRDQVRGSIPISAFSNLQSINLKPRKGSAQVYASNALWVLLFMPQLKSAKLSIQVTKLDVKLIEGYELDFLRGKSQVEDCDINLYEGPGISVEGFSEVIEGIVSVFHLLKSFKIQVSNNMHSVAALQSLNSLHQNKNLEYLQLMKFMIGQAAEEDLFAPPLAKLLSLLPSLKTLSSDFGLMITFVNLSLPPNIKRFDFAYNVMEDQDGEGECPNVESPGMTEISELKNHSLEEIGTYRFPVDSNIQRKKLSPEALERWKVIREEFFNYCKKEKLEIIYLDEEA